MNEREYLALRLSDLTCYEEIRKAQLKFMALESLWENKDPAFHVWFSQEYNKLLKEDEVLKKLGDEVRVVQGLSGLH